MALNLKNSTEAKQNKVIYKKNPKDKQDIYLNRLVSKEEIQMTRRHLVQYFLPLCIQTIMSEISAQHSQKDCYQTG